MLLSVECMVSDAAAFNSFVEYVEERSNDDKMWRLWTNFVLKDCFSYIRLFLAIRMSNRELRQSSLKSMAALFSAYNQPCYQKLVPDHLADLQRYPSDIVECFRAGGFTVKKEGRVGHAIALDEAHRMCINRDIKMAVTRPMIPYLKKTKHFFAYRIKSQKQLESQLFSEGSETPASGDILATDKLSLQWDETIKDMHAHISSRNLPHSYQLSRNIRDSPGFNSSVPDERLLVPEARLQLQQTL